MTPLFAAPLLLAAFAQGGVSAEERAAFKTAADAAAESVVRVETLGGADVAGGQLVSSGPASGVVVSADGLILTSTFAFLGDPTGVLVRLPDGRRVAAERLGTDESRQVALLRVDADGLTPAVPANIGDIAVGDWAVAVGRTYSADAVNVSVGIVSAKDRILGRAVQTDAKTSPANYGGALVDLSGRTIGVLAPLTGDGGTGGVEWYDSGIGFAVPLADILPVLDRLEAGETLRPGLLGVAFAGSGLDAEPVVESVRPQSPAEAAGLRPGGPGAGSRRHAGRTAGRREGGPRPAAGGGRGDDDGRAGRGTGGTDGDARRGVAPGPAGGTRRAAGRRRRRRSRGRAAGVRVPRLARRGRGADGRRHDHRRRQGAGADGGAPPPARLAGRSGDGSDARAGGRRAGDGGARRRVGRTARGVAGPRRPRRRPAA